VIPAPPMFWLPSALFVIPDSPPTCEVPSSLTVVARFSEILCFDLEYYRCVLTNNAVFSLDDYLREGVGRHADRDRYPVEELHFE